MSARILIMLLILFISPSSSSADKQQVALTFVQFSAEEVVVYSVPKAILAAQKYWVPGEGKVPLGVSNALEVARSRYPNNELTSIRLAKSEFSEREVWFYIFEFMGQKQAVVLMSGDLVESETVKEQEFFQRLRGQ